MTFVDWDINIAGNQGPAGARGASGPAGVTGTTGPAGGTVLPTIKCFTSGSGTWNRPSGCTMIKLKLVGAGASGGYVTPIAGVDGGDTIWGSGMFVAGGGKAPPAGMPWTGGQGGVPSGTGTWYDAVKGGTGQGLFAAGGGSAHAYGGGVGGNAAGRGGGGAGATDTADNRNASAAPNSGGGGGGWGNQGFWANQAGGAGATIWAQINNPSANYTYAVGAGGVLANYAGSGANGIIIVEEFY